MNLNNNPTPTDLAALMAPCSDNAEHHIVWVDKQGEVFITPCSLADMIENMQFRFETFAQGQGFVGTGAAQNGAWVNKLFNALVDFWEKGAVGFQEFF